MADTSMKAPFPIDLQVHSTQSDGTDTPTELVAKAAQLGVKILALTDHDSVLGVDEAVAAGQQHNLQIVPALEFSTTSEAERDFLDINILAYGIRHRDPELQKMLTKVLEGRVEQKIRQIERLQSYGVDVPVDVVLASAQGVPGRVHIANVALERNPSRFSSIQDVFELHLRADAPQSAHVKRLFSLCVEEAIDLTHQAGGFAVLAHPGCYTRVRDVDDVVRRLSQAGLDGLEVNYTYAQNRGHYNASPQKVAQLIAHYDRLADECGLLKTGGSDYHGTTKPGIHPGQAGLTVTAWEALCEKGFSTI